MKSIFSTFKGLHKDGKPLDFLATWKKTFDKDRKIVLTAKGQRRFDLDVKTKFNTGAETITPDTPHKLLERYMRLQAMKAAPALLDKKDPTVVKMKKDKETFVDQSIGTTKLVENYKFK